MAIEKQVRFGGTSCDLLEDDFTGHSQKDLIWYDKAHFLNNVQCLTAEGKGMNEDDEAASLCLSEGSRRRRSHHVHSILCMQSEANKMGMKDATGLRSLSVALSKAEGKSARERATQGANEAFYVYAESTKWMHGITPKEYAQQTRIRPMRSKKNSPENGRQAINKEALRIVWAC